MSDTIDKCSNGLPTQVTSVTSATLPDVAIVNQMSSGSKCVDVVEGVIRSQVKRGGTRGGNPAALATWREKQRALKTIVGNGKGKIMGVAEPKGRVGKKFCEMILNGMGLREIQDQMEVSKTNITWLMRRYRGWLLGEIVKRRNELVADGILRSQDALAEFWDGIQKGDMTNEAKARAWLRLRNNMLATIKTEGRSNAGRKALVVIVEDEEEKTTIDAVAEVKQSV